MIWRAVTVCVLPVWVVACSGGSTSNPVGTDQAAVNCSGSCASASSRLAVADVEKILAQGAAEAHVRGLNATIAVVDRVGNVLAVYRMGAAVERQVVIATSLDGSGHSTVSAGLEGIRLPVPKAPLNIDDQAAIAKAVTGAYLSSEGNAFSTRTGCVRHRRSC